MTRGNGLPSRSGHGRPAHVCTREQLGKAPLTLGSVIGEVPAGGGFAQDRLHDEKAHQGIHFCGPPRDLRFKIFPDYGLSSAIKVEYKPRTFDCFCGFERWHGTKSSFKEASVRLS